MQNIANGLGDMLSGMANTRQRQGAHKPKAKSSMYATSTSIPYSKIPQMLTPTRYFWQRTKQQATRHFIFDSNFTPQSDQQIHGNTRYVVALEPFSINPQAGSIERFVNNYMQDMHKEWIKFMKSQSQPSYVPNKYLVYIIDNNKMALFRKTT